MGHTALAPRPPQERKPPHNDLILPVAPADWERGSGLQLDLRNKLAALRFSHCGVNVADDLETDTPLRAPFLADEHDDKPNFPVWLWNLRADSIRNAVPFILEARSAAFWHQLYLEGIAPRINSLLAWCTGEEGQP
jgi:hypothetical protein